MMDENRLDNIVECSYNMDNGYVEVWYVDGNMLRIKCEEVEAAPIFTVPVAQAVVAAATPVASVLEKDFSGFGDTDDDFEFDDID